jgi:hypothetical protein
MLYSRTYFPVLLTLSIFLSACEKPRPTVVEAKPKDTIQLPSVPRSRVADDTARFFAALPSAEGSPFAELEKGAVWQSHKTSMDAAWSKAHEQLLDGLHEFASKELDPKIIDGRTVFYSFSGPDMMTATYYYPKSPLYILIGLEPPGTFPTYEQIEKKKNLPGYLAAMRSTMASILGRSFFVTREMDSELRGQTTDGILLPMLHLLVRTNHTILGVRYVRVDDDGKIVERPLDWKTDSKFANRGVEVEFESAPGAPSQRAYYFSINLDDEHLGANSSFKAFLARVTDTVSMFKATSYMTHHDEFSLIRNHVLNNSVMVVQDDSGIPFHFYTPDKWDVALYGDYDKPYGSFRYMQEKDLRDAFKSGKPKALPMHIGYGYRRIESNLEVATRKDVQPPLADAAAAQSK